MRLYKHHITPFLQVLLVLCVLATLASCVSDKFWEELEASRDTGMTPYYLSLKVIDTSSSLARTRDGGNTEDNKGTGDVFGDGDETEHCVGEDGNYVIFLKDGKFFELSKLTLRTHMDNKDDNLPPSNNKKEATYTARFYAKNGEVPGSCLIVMNGIKIEDKLKTYNENTTLNDIITTAWGDTDNPKNIGFDDPTTPSFFTLTNSIYADNKGLHTVVEIPEDYIVKSPAEADLKNKHLTVYVERMVAKFQFSVEGGEWQEDNTFLFTPENNTIPYCTFDESGNPTYTERKFRIRVTGWNMNALETQSYLFKNVSSNGYWSGWSKYGSTQHHSCWGADTHYTNSDYPWQFRKAVNSPLTYYGENYNETTDGNLLRNYSFVNLNDNDWGKIIYAPENTYDWAAVEGKHDSRENLLAGTHLIVCAQLETDLDNDGNFEVEEHLYRDRTGVFYKDAKDCFWGLVRSFDLDFQSQALMDFKSYNWNATKGSNGESRTAVTIYGKYFIHIGNIDDWDEAAKNQKDLDTEDRTGGAYKLYHNGTKITYQYICENFTKDEFFTDAIIKDGDGKVLPWLDNLTIATDDDRKARLQIYKEATIRYKYEGGSTVVVGENPANATDNERKSILLSWMGAVDYFKDGRMYYAAPVRHNDLKSAEDQLTNLGDCGVVRNHWYKFTLKSFNKIGTSVYKDKDPIVPNNTITHDQQNITVDILDWHYFDITAPVL